jgi:outer membrane PBP1 activator LpoA protein
MIRRLAVLVALVLIASCSAFAPSRNVVHTQMMTPSTSTQLHEKRTWNFNEGRSPWGLKNNAEIWNGRVAQVRFLNSMDCGVSLSVQNSTFDQVRFLSSAL